MIPRVIMHSMSSPFSLPVFILPRRRFTCPGCSCRLNLHSWRKFRTNTRESSGPIALGVKTLFHVWTFALDYIVRTDEELREWGKGCPGLIRFGGICRVNFIFLGLARHLFGQKEAKILLIRAGKVWTTLLSRLRCYGRYRVTCNQLSKSKILSHCPHGMRLSFSTVWIFIAMCTTFEYVFVNTI